MLFMVADLDFEKDDVVIETINTRCFWKLDIENSVTLLIYMILTAGGKLLKKTQLMFGPANSNED